MQYRQLGSSGFQVSLLGLGGNTFGQHEGWEHYNDEARSLAIIDRAADLGINHIDTADMYSHGVSETYIGKAIAGRRGQFIVASKVGIEAGEGPNDAGLSRGHIMASIEGTLRRLGTDYVDLYYAHEPDPATPIEETLRAFDDLVRQGKVRYLGCSNFAGWQIAAAQARADCRGYAPFMVSQSPYNLLNREIEAEIMPSCQHTGMSIVAYAPLAQGVLTGKYRRGEPIKQDTRAWQNPSENLEGYMADAKLAKVERLSTWAKDHGYSVGDLAIAWVACRPSVCSVLTGVTSSEQLEANAGATEWVLTGEQLEEIETIITERVEMGGA
jgi:aryl-alcohol dehydrogenase-like predicted oxidoreductase